MSKKKSEEKTELAVLHHPHEGHMSVIVLERKDGKVRCTPEADEAGFPKRNEKREHGTWGTVKDEDGQERYKQVKAGEFEDEAWFDEALVETVKK